MTEIIVKKGTYGRKPVENVKFEMVIPPKMGVKGLYVTVKGEPIGMDRNIRVMLENEGDVKFLRVDGVRPPEMTNKETASEEEHEETDDEIIARMRRKFQILDGMTIAAIQKNVRAMIVTGPPGVGKSYGIESVIDGLDVMIKMEMLDPKTVDLKAKMSMEKVSNASPLGLYQLLWEYHKPGSLLVLDDSDSVLYDESCLNMLKAATDSGKSRKLSWRTESRVLDDAGIPSEFTFEGAIIFVTNLDFENTRGKIGEHMKAIVSRCHYLDVGMATAREKFLRCKQIIKDGMLDRYKFDDVQKDELLTYLDTNKHRLRELSLRMVTKVADLMKMEPDYWKTFADETCLKGR